MDWFDCFTIRPFLRTTWLNRGSVEAEAFFSIVLLTFCLFICRVGVAGRVDEVIAAAAAASAAPRATNIIYLIHTSLRKHISRLVSFLSAVMVTVSLLVSWLLSSRECISKPPSDWPNQRVFYCHRNRCGWWSLDLIDVVVNGVVLEVTEMMGWREDSHVYCRW